MPFISAIKMPFDLLYSSALSGMQVIINKALTLAPSTSRKLARLSGQTIAVESTSPSLEFFITVLDEGVLLGHQFDQQPDARISASASALMQLLLADDKTEVIRRKGIGLHGKTESIQTLQECLASLNIDWEYQFSKILGDIPTQALSDGLKALQEFIGESSSRMRTNIDEYLHEEIKMFPTRVELENFYREIDQLRLRLDRNRARLERLERINSQ